MTQNAAAIAPWGDRAVNAVAAGLARVTPLTAWIGATQRATIWVERLLRRTGRDDDAPAVRWHEGGRGPALLLLNGFSASGHLWPTAFVSELEEHYRVIRIDNRCTGGSRGAPTPFTIATMADDARDVLHACGEKKAVVVGISMGGVVAQELAIRHPDAVDRLVLMATIPPPPAQVPPPDVAKLLRILLGPFDETRQSDADYRAKAGQSILAFTSPGFTVTDELRSEVGAQVLVQATTRMGAMQQSRAIVAWHGPMRLARVQAPTTVFTGEDDPIIPVTNGERIAALIPGAEHVVLPGVGHMVPWEAGPAILDVLQPTRR